MRLVKITTIFVLLLLLAVPAILSIGIRKLPSGFQTALSDSEYIYGDTIVTQSFVASENNLSAIGLTVKNPYLKNKKDLIFTLTSETGESRTVVINGANIYDGDFVSFAFDPISGSKGKNILFSFKSPQTSSDESFELYHTAGSSAGSFSVNGLEKTGQLAFVSYYKPSSIFSTWGIIYGQWAGKLFQDLFFLLTYFLLLLVIGIYLTNSFIRKKSS